MDGPLRQLERTREDNPEHWLRAVSRSGLIEQVRLTEPNIYWDALIRCGRLGPTNCAVFGMLGFRPVVKLIGGDDRVGPRFTYWFKDKWYTEKQVLHESARGYRNWQEAGPFRNKLNRLSFYIRRIEWMKQVALKLKKNWIPLDVWLVDRESRTVLLSSLIGESWTPS